LKNDPRFYSRLLSERPELSIQEKESILNDVLSHVEREEKPKATWLFGSVSNVAKLASLALFVALAIPVVVLLLQNPEGDAFIEKGTEAEPPLFSIKCLSKERETNTCSPGSKLVFNVYPPKGRRYFSSFAKRESDGVIIWYFPKNEKEKSFDTRLTSAGGVLSKGIVLGTEHTAGAYTIYGVFSAEPISRILLKQKFDNKLHLKDNSLSMSTVVFIME
jgi:hypothetical protein